MKPELDEMLSALKFARSATITYQTKSDSYGGAIIERKPIIEIKTAIAMVITSYSNLLEKLSVWVME